MSSIAARQRHNNKINRCRGQSCQAKTSNAIHTIGRLCNQSLIGRSVSYLTRAFESLIWIKNALSTTLPGVTTMTTVDSALGQKQIFKRLRLMSALSPKADMTEQDRDVRFVPKADMGSQNTCALTRLLCRQRLA